MSKKVLLVVGSLREKSFNKTVAKYVESKLNEKGLEVKFLDYANVPLFNQDVEFPAPSSVEKVRNEAVNASALWIFTPEYNGYVPGVLKNLLDWLSRPLAPELFADARILAQKPVTVSGIAGGSKAGFVIPRLEGLLEAMTLNVIKESTGLALPVTAWTTGEFELSNEQKEELDKQVEKFVESI